MPVSWNSLNELRNEIFGSTPSLTKFGEQGTYDLNSSIKLNKINSGETIKCQIKDFYLTNVICRASNTMAELSKLRKDNICLDKVG